MAWTRPLTAPLLFLLTFSPTLLVAQEPVQPHTLEQLLARDTFEEIRLSPDGEHLALTVPLEDRTVLQIVRRSDMTTTHGVNPGTNNIIVDVAWVNNERLVFSFAEKFGDLDQPLYTGELFATNIDGTQQELLVGLRGEGQRSGSRIDKGRQAEGSAFLLDVLPNDDRKVLIRMWPWSQRFEPQAQVEELDVYTGKRQRVATAPVPRANFLTDHAGAVRFAWGAGVNNRVQTYYRADNDAEWQLINDQDKSKIIVTPLAFSADNATAWLQAGEQEGPDGIYAMDTATLERTLVLRGDFADPHSLLRDPTGRHLVGARYFDGLPVMRYFDRKSPDAILYRILEKSFPGQMIRIESGTRDGRLAVLEVSNDRSPGDVYLFDTEQKKADLLKPRMGWIQAARTAPMQPVELAARDGLKLHGYLTKPLGSEDRLSPLIVLPHGGPYGIADTWGYDPEVQILAAHGYAVLQVNFRGSGGYGRAFEVAGHRQWGRQMQDDLTDATRWAIEQGHADAQRICIYGASYGGYAALMGVAKEPDLYQCAIGYIGVYDLPLMYKEGDIAERRSGTNYLTENMGTEGLEEVSPARLAQQIKVPVFLAAGGEDQRAPLEHTEAMQKALERAGVPVETLIYPDEGHGFYKEAHQLAFYRQLLSFLDENIGADED